MRYGIRNGSLKANWQEALRIAGEIGFDGVEFVVRPEDDLGELLTNAGQQRILGWCRESKCAVSSLSVAAFRQVSFGSADAQARERGVPFVEQCLRACRAVGGDAVLLPHFERETINPTEEQERNFIEGLRRSAPIAEREQVKIALETSFGVEPLQRIMRAVNSPWVGVYQDTSNALYYGHDTVDMLTRLAKETVMIHLKDTGQSFLGEGNVDWPGTLTAVREMGYDGWLVFETPGGDDPRAAAARNLRFARETFGA
jgi:sugar phosphate isomerase/epimerase